MQCRLTFVFCALLFSCTPALCIAADGVNTEGGYYEVWLRDVRLALPGSFVMDMRYYTEDEGLIVLRQNVDGEETGRTIGLALQPLDQKSLNAFRLAGYSHSKHCEFDVFSRDDETVKSSIIVVIEQGFVQLANLDESLAEGVLESLCERALEGGP